VPALGYSVFHVLAKRSGSALKEPLPRPANVDSIENDLYKLTFKTSSGEIVSLVDKSTGAECLNGPANVVARQEDKGDLWELYHTLDGASYIPATNKQPTPTNANALLSSASSDKAGTIIQGPLFSEFKINHPMGDGSFSTRVRLSQGSRRIDIETEIVNNQKNVRYQVLFPTTIKNGNYRQEIPFGSVDRPVGVEYPAQNWVDYGDGQHGMSLLNAGMPGNVVAEDGTLMLSLLRSQTLGDYNEGHTSESGYELAMPRKFHYALLPHVGDWNTANTYREGQELNCPLLVFKAEKHPGSLPKQWGMVVINRPDVVLSAFKPGPKDTAILRVYEASGKQNSGVRITLSARIRAASEANLIEAPGAKVKVEGNSVMFDLHPFEIKTIWLTLAPAGRS
jgi:alpha-mannosidase